MKEFIIEEGYQNLRLDKAISSKYEDLSRTMIQKLIDEGKIWVNEKNQKASYKVYVRRCC